MFCALICCLFCIDSGAQGFTPAKADVEASLRNKRLIVADLRPKLFNDLTGDEARIYREIKFEVSADDQLIRAFSSRQNGMRRVTVTESMGRALELNADALLMDQAYRMPGFLGDYIEYVCEMNVINSNRLKTRLGLLKIDSPYDRAKWSDTDLEKFYSDPELNKLRNVQVGGAYAFLLAHEVGHHVLGHVDNPTRILARRRMQEAAADEWAINLVLKKHVSPVSGIIPLLYSYFTELNPVATEAGNDHPADARRLLAMYEGVARRLPEFRPYIAQSGQSYEEVQNQVASAIALIKQEIAASQAKQ